MRRRERSVRVRLWSGTPAFRSKRGCTIIVPWCSLPCFLLFHGTTHGTVLLYNKQKTTQGRSRRTMCVARRRPVLGEKGQLSFCILLHIFRRCLQTTAKEPSYSSMHTSIVVYTPHTPGMANDGRWWRRSNFSLQHTNQVGVMKPDCCPKRRSGLACELIWGSLRALSRSAPKSACK